MISFNGHPVKAAIFDVDGTLIDSFSFYHTLLNEGLKLNGFAPVSKDLLFEHLGMSSSPKALLRDIIPPDQDDRVVDRVAKQVSDRFKQVEYEIPLFPGVRSVFDFLSRWNIPIGIATGRTSSVAHEWDVLKKYNLDRFVHAVVTGLGVENRKPAPDLIKECARLLEAPAQACLAVGDTASDILAAKDAGAIPIGITTGIDSRETLNQHGPETVLERLDELIGLLER